MSRVEASRPGGSDASRPDQDYCGHDLTSVGRGERAVIAKSLRALGFAGTMHFCACVRLVRTGCDTEQEVTDGIAEYMQAEGAVLNRVSVIRVPETGNTVVAGEELSPAYFWTPPH